MPPNHISRLSTPTPVMCACCRRQAGPRGDGSALKRQPYLWSCHDEDCFQSIKRIRNMSTENYNDLEVEAIVEGGRLAFQYLDSLGKEDRLYSLSKEEAIEFFKRANDGREAHMRAKLIADRG